MASPARRLPTNVPGDVYVDATCIDCATCRWMAPETFSAAAGKARVHRQPADPVAIDRALAALVACPTGSIGTVDRHDTGAVARSFPRRVEGEVYHCGFHAEASFGAASWLIRRPEGNVLVDSPRFAVPLVAGVEALGGIRWLVLTHRDDVADHAKWARRFGSERVIHAGDASAVPGAERVLVGGGPVELAPGVVIVPTPGHTRGSVCVHVDDRYLLTGDSLAGDEDDPSRLIVFEDATWFSWDELRTSLEGLLPLRFAWVLPGHGAPAHGTPGAMHAALERCVAAM
jgi:glyoxylase-like metal-dependent hydrolase (beta-lactamase superfamily II)/ferredoxin